MNCERIFTASPHLSTRKKECSWLATNYWYSSSGFMGLPAINIYTFTLPDIVTKTQCTRTLTTTFDTWRHFMWGSQMETRYKISCSFLCWNPMSQIFPTLQSKVDENCEDDEDVECLLTAVPHSPLLAPTKCDRWGGNLGALPLHLPPPHPPLPILPSHPESIWENGGSFLRGTMMDQVAIAPHTDHQWKKFSESAQWGSWETRIAKFDTRWISPRKIFNWYLVRYFWPTPCMTPSHNYHPGMPD